MSIEIVDTGSAWALVVAEGLSGKRALVLAGLVTGEPVQLLFDGQQRAVPTCVGECRHVDRTDAQ